MRPTQKLDALFGKQFGRDFGQMIVVDTILFGDTLEQKRHAGQCQFRHQQCGRSNRIAAHVDAPPRYLLDGVLFAAQLGIQERIDLEGSATGVGGDLDHALDLHRPYGVGRGAGCITNLGGLGKRHGNRQQCSSAAGQCQTNQGFHWVCLPHFRLDPAYWNPGGSFLECARIPGYWQVADEAILFHCRSICRRVHLVQSVRASSLAYFHSPVQAVIHSKGHMGKIGFIGLGRMGRPMALNLRKKGFELVVFDVNKIAMQELLASGAQSAGTVAELAKQCPIVITMLPSSVEVEQVALGANGVFANAVKGCLFMDMSTIDPLATDRLAAEALKLAAIRWSMRRLAVWPSMRIAASVCSWSAPAEADFMRVKPLFDAMGTSTYHCGAVGAGGRTKLVNNYVAITLTQVNAEALALSQRFGLDLVKTMQVLLGTSANNGQLRMNFPSKVLAGDTTPGFTIDLAHKDLSLVLGAAQASQVPMPVLDAVHQSFSQAREASYGKIDFSGIADVLCERADIKKPRLPAGWKPA